MTGGRSVGGWGGSSSTNLHFTSPFVYHCIWEVIWSIWCCDECQSMLKLPEEERGLLNKCFLFINMFWSQAKGCECTWCTALRVVLFGRVCVERVSLLRSGLDTVSQPVWPLAPSLSRCRPSVQSPINAPPLWSHQKLSHRKEVKLFNLSPLLFLLSLHGQV